MIRDFSFSKRRRLPPVSAFNLVAEYRSRTRRGAGSIPARRICSRFGRPAAEDGRQIAVSVYCGKIAAVIPAIEYVAGQQVFKQLF